MQAQKHYKVTGWHSENPRQVMRVWTDTVTDETVRGHVIGADGVSTSVWPREMADGWTWTEVEK